MGQQVPVVGEDLDGMATAVRFEVAQDDELRIE
jgi:hypothetical protein